MSDFTGLLIGRARGGRGGTYGSDNQNPKGRVRKKKVEPKSDPTSADSDDKAAYMARMKAKMKR